MLTHPFKYTDTVSMHIKETNKQAYTHTYAHIIDIIYVFRYEYDYISIYIQITQIATCLLTL